MCGCMCSDVVFKACRDFEFSDHITPTSSATYSPRKTLMQHMGSFKIVPILSKIRNQISVTQLGGQSSVKPGLEDSLKFEAKNP